MNHTPRSRERTEELERASLSTWATLTVETKGREQEEEPDHLRTAFQQDCERILSSKAFQRLRGKTHSLLAPPDGDGPRVRLTHTLAVTHTARTIARALRLNEDLAEAIALGHDLGATAFATAGEEALSTFTDQPFKHHEQGLRVVERIEGGGRGLNLTWEVRDGILCHAQTAQAPATLEGQVVRVTTRLVGLTSDLDDALRTGVCLLRDLPEEVRRVLGETHSTRVTALVEAVVSASSHAPEIELRPPVARALETLAAFIAERVRGRGEQAERARGIHCLRSLVVFHLDNPDRLPSAHRGDDDPLETRTLDFVSSLTDAQALQLFQRLLLPTVTP